MPTPKQEASLRDWEFEWLELHSCNIAIGNVSGHPLFPDGQRIHTSKIINYNVKNGIIETAWRIMNSTKLLKAANSKGKLVKAVLLYQNALSHYANENNWAVKTNELHHIVGKLLKEQGEAFRLAHAELLDAFQAASEDSIVWLGDDDPTYAAQVVLAKRKVDPGYNERNKKSVREPDNNEVTPNATNKG